MIRLGESTRVVINCGYECWLLIDPVDEVDDRVRWKETETEMRWMIVDLC